MPAILPVVRVFDLQQLKILFPIRTFFLERRGAIARLHPVRDAIFTDPRLFHVIDIFVTGNGAPTQRAVPNGLPQSLFPTGFYPCFDQITHGKP